MALAFDQMTVSIPNPLADKAAAFPEASHGANRVTLVLGDGRRVCDVFLGWGRDIVKVGNRVVSRPEDLDFRPTDIVDVLSEVK